MTYAFTFDASACSGCKACQVACKDKNNLPVGVLWRRVYEVSGGSWQRDGGAWRTDVFAYNLSIACNHCVHPKCAGVCPTDAYVQREDGIVYIDESKCIGCGYCNWACPYGVPQYNPELGHMTKCNFCMDNLEVDLPPACVAACPLRVLDFVEMSGNQLPGNSFQHLWDIPAKNHPFPLPKQSRTEPHLAIKPHVGMLNGLEKVISNREEIRPRHEKSKVRRIWSPKSPDFGIGELPLVAFTLLGQMVAGMAVFAFFSGPLTAPMLFTIGGLIGLGGLASLMHLGAPKNAWRAVIHLRKSWLSREILMFGLFGISWLISLALPGMGKLPLAMCGLGLIFSMSKVYRLRSMPVWNTNRTLLAFLVSALLLGGIGVSIWNNFGKAAFIPFTSLLLGAGMFVALGLSLTDRDQTHRTARRLRLGLIGLGLIGALGIFVVSNTVERWLIVPIFIIVLIEEGIGRWLFYEGLHQRIL